MKKRSLIEEAARRHEKIFPIGDRKSFGKCFTKDRLMGWCFWYDTKDGSSHVIYEKKVPTSGKNSVYC